MSYNQTVTVNCITVSLPAGDTNYLDFVNNCYGVGIAYRTERLVPMLYTLHDVAWI